MTIITSLATRLARAAGKALRIAAGVLALCTGATLLAAAPMLVKTLDGEQFEGEVVAWSDDQIELEVGQPSGPRTIPVAELLRLDRSDSGASRARAQDVQFVELIDGSRLPVESVAAQGREIHGATPYGPLTLPTARVHWAELAPRTAASAELWAELEAKELDSDLLIVAKRGGAAFDYLSGVVGDISDQQVEFRWEGEPMTVKRAKIAGVFFYHQNAAQLPEARCVLRTANDAQIAARSITLALDKLHVATAAGLELAVPLADVASADFSAGKLVYLSDLKPTDARWIPRVALPGGAALAAQFGQPRFDESFAGSPLTLAWPGATGATPEIRPYDKGLAVRSRTELAWRLPAGMSKFLALAGIDPESTGQGRAQLAVRADDRVLWEGAIDGRRPPVVLDLNLRDARRLRITVDYGDNLDYGDRLHLIDARVTR